MTIARPTDRPRIALLGEFSAGKSTLLNLLLKGAHSPVRVTATQLPPIWYTYGDGQAVHIARNGTENPLPGNDLSAAPLDDTTAIRVEVAADILTRCDLLDMPGSSDPNMTPDIWDTLLPTAEGAIWCTPATQAWRQSEAAIWEEVPEALWSRAILLLTRIDKIRMTDDRKRLLARVRRETQGYFRSVHPAALLQAHESPENAEAWADSGMGPVMDALEAILAEIGGAPARPGGEVVPMPGVTPTSPPSGAKPAVMPRRVVRADGRSARSRRASGEGSLL